MANTARQRTMATGLVIGAVVLTGRAGIASAAPVSGVVHRTDHADNSANTLPRVAAQDPQTGPHVQGEQFLRVRSSDASIVEWIKQATARSPTFKRLVATIERSNGIIHVESGVCRGRVASCLPIWMISSGSHRFLRITVDRRRLDTGPLLVGAIGHELQHSIEALSDPHVTDSTKMQFFYQRYAPTDKARFETPEAIHVGIAVEDEWRTWCGAHR
jgi:hypothetical protein